MTDVKVWGNRALVKRQTYAESACWYSLQVAKLTVPLSYNFITMLRADVYQETSFYKFLGQLINLTPLGQGFSTFFPCFLLLPVLATFFNLYGKVKNILGFGLLEDDSENDPSGFGTGGWPEGRALIARELQARSQGGGAVGLAARGGFSDIERQAVTNAGSSTPPQSSAQSRAPQPSHVQAANRQFNSITNQEEEDDSARHFYQDFSERVKNTFDSVDRPEWMRNLGSGVSAPKWMQGSQGDGASGPASTVSRWFGGRAEEGRVRL